MEPLRSIICLLSRQVLNNLMGDARATYTSQVQWGNTTKRHRIDLPGVLAPDGAVKFCVCSSLANPAASHVSIIMTNPQSFAFSLCHAWQCLPFCTLLAFLQVEMLILNSGRKRGDNRTTTAVANVGSPWAPGERARSDGLHGAEEVMSWPAHRSF